MSNQEQNRLELDAHIASGGALNAYGDPADMMYRIRRCLVPPLNDQHFTKFMRGGLDNGDFYF